MRRHAPAPRCDAPAAIASIVAAAPHFCVSRAHRRDGLPPRTRARARAVNVALNAEGDCAAALRARSWRDRNDNRFHGGRAHRRASIIILRCRSSSPWCSVRGASADVLPWRVRPCHMLAHPAMLRVIPSALVEVINPLLHVPTQRRRRVGASYSYHRNRILNKITARGMIPFPTYSPL